GRGRSPCARVPGCAARHRRRLRPAGGVHRRGRPRPRGTALRRCGAGEPRRAGDDRPRGPRDAGGGRGRRRPGVLRVGATRRRPATHLRAVADLPFVIGRIERRGETLHAWLNDGAEQDVDPGTLRIGREDVPYVAVKGGVFEARLSRAAAYQLLALADYDERSGRGALRLGGREYALARAS